MISRFLLTLSGANLEMLEECPRDRSRYLGIGGAVLSTSLMAAFAATLALQMTVDAPIAVAVAFGVVWGLIIMNLDRWLVASTNRDSSWWRTLLVLIPRLALAVVIGGIIAEPLILRVFEPEIEAELETMQGERQRSFEASLVDDPTTLRVAALSDSIRTSRAVVETGVTAGDLSEDPEVARLRGERADLREQRDDVIFQIDCEARGTCGTANYGEGPEFRRLTERRAELDAEILALEAELDIAETQAATARTTGAESAISAANADIDANSAELARLQQELKDRRAEFNSFNDDRTGLLARMEALDRMTEDSDVLASRFWALRIFVILIDSLPVLVKMMMVFSPPTMYERRARAANERETLQLDADAKKQPRAAEIMSALVIDEANVNYKLQSNATKTVNTKVVETETEIAGIVLDNWKESQVVDVSDSAHPQRQPRKKTKALNQAGQAERISTRPAG